MGPLARTFDAVVFDWDGTAVPDRQAPAGRVRQQVEQLCAAGVDLAVVSGTHLGNVDGQLAARPRGPGRLLLALNRGSELFEVGPDGPRLVWQRQATADEDAALDRAAALVVERLAARGLHADVVSVRVNRRKIDLLPVPEWADPPKARIDDLVLAVTARLRAAGVADLAAVVDLAVAAAREAGLADPRVTSDAKHVEIGLTDKSDSMRLLLAELRGGPVLVVGDEFGRLGGCLGSDALLLLQGEPRLTAVSVGVEPTGVPPGVLHLPGGPETFGALLDEQLARRAPAVISPVGAAR